MSDYNFDIQISAGYAKDYKEFLEAELEYQDEILHSYSM